MWWPKARRAGRSALLFFAVLALAGPALSGCTLSPVYWNGEATQSNLVLNFAEPNSRLEQVFYQRLDALGITASPQAPTLRVSIGISESRVGLSSASSPVSDRQVIATASYSVSENGTVIASGKRTAVSGYQRVGQAFTDDRAQANAEEQAVTRVAEAVRLALLAQNSLQ